MSKESHRGQASGRRESPHGGPERSLYDAMEVKPGLCWRTPRCPKRGAPAKESCTQEVEPA